MKHFLQLAAQLITTTQQILIQIIY